MPSKFFIPKRDNEGGIGSRSKCWGEGHFKRLMKNSKYVASVNDTIRRCHLSYGGRLSDNHDGWKVGDIVRQIGGTKSLAITFQDVVAGDNVNSVYSFNCNGVSAGVNSVFILTSSKSVNIIFNEEGGSGDYVAQTIADNLSSFIGGVCSVSGSTIVWTMNNTDDVTYIDNSDIIPSWSRVGALPNNDACISLTLFSNINGEVSSVNFVAGFSAGETGEGCAIDLCNIINASSYANESLITTVSNNTIIIRDKAEFLTSVTVEPYGIENNPNRNLAGATYTLTDDSSTIFGAFFVMDITKLTEEAGYLQFY